MNQGIETIIAHSTPKGTSGLAIIRISGSRCSKIIEKFFKQKVIKPRKIQLNYFYDFNLNKIDQVIFVYYKSPASYTGEDMIEIFPHGSPAIIDKILEELLYLKNVRIAKPGEFAKRAILAKKITLMDAENINNLIQAQTEYERKLISWQSFGGLTNKLDEWNQKLVRLSALCEAIIEFDEEDDTISLTTLEEDLLHLLKLVNDSLKNSKLLKKALEGKKIVICGPPNVGKSSIFNVLNQEDRSIVSKKVGTTRDYISSQMFLRDKKISIFDTAGIRTTGNSIEKIGVKKTAELIRKETNIILVLSADILKEKLYISMVKDLLKTTKRKKFLVIYNKSDLCKQTKELWQKEIPELKKPPFITISCVNPGSDNNMYGKLLKFLEKNILEDHTEMLENGGFIEKRHFEHLKKMKKHLILATENLNDIDIVAEEIRLSLLELENIIGKVEIEKKFDFIFENFCIGK